MNTRPRGQTGLHVTALGFGVMHLNDGRVSELDADRLLTQLLGLGVKLIDTARGHGLSEERIGRHIAHRRQEFVLSTKVGTASTAYRTGPVPAPWLAWTLLWTRMRCEILNIVHMHSCPLHTLEQGEVITALEECERAAK